MQVRIKFNINLDKETIEGVVESHQNQKDISFLREQLEIIIDKLVTKHLKEEK